MDKTLADWMAEYRTWYEKYGQSHTTDASGDNFPPPPPPPDAGLGNG